mmetsp:Transcript_22482/g.51831  ORF Transcript_22482/g.51831 Transcript_22482/m.51831 type:complete len:142 (+) Transcript_22482:240-665(+)
MYFFNDDTSNSPSPVVATLRTFSAMASDDKTPSSKLYKQLSPTGFIQDRLGQPDYLHWIHWVVIRKRVLSFLTCIVVHMNSHDVIADRPVSFFISHIPNQEDQIKSAQNGCHEVNILTRRLEVVVSPKHRVGGSQDTAAAV